MRLGPLNAESNKHAPTESESHLAWTEVVPAPCKIVIDAVGISDVPGSSGINIRPPNVLLASAGSGNVAAMAFDDGVDVKPSNILLASAESGDLAATAFDDDLVRHVNDENATVVRGNSTGNAARLAC
jgi:hypothetical protein